MFKHIRNFLIGLLIISAGLYVLLVSTSLMAYSLDWQLLREDVFKMGWTTSLNNLAYKIHFAEHQFINNYYLAKLLSVIPIVGSNLFFALLSLWAMHFGYRVCYCNLFPKKQQ